MALIATTFIIEIILIIVGLFLFDGGLIRQLGAMGMFANGISLAYSSQKYVSDATTPITNVSLFFTPEIQSALVTGFAILFLITVSFFFLNVLRIYKFMHDGGKMSFTMMLEELV